MSTGIISARDFMDGNGLFSVQLHKEGDDKKSYKTRTQLYVMECAKCSEQVEQRGNAKFECRRCRRFVSPVIGDDGKIKWVIDESSLKEKKVMEALNNAPKVFFKNGKYLEPESESEEEEEENIPAPVKKPIPKGDEMIDFLKTAASESGKKSKDRPKKKIEAVVEDAGADIDEGLVEEIAEPIIPKKKEKTAPSKKPTEYCPVVSEVQMKVITLKPGQTYFCKELNMLFVGASE